MKMTFHHQIIVHLMYLDSFYLVMMKMMKMMTVAICLVLILYIVYNLDLLQWLTVVFYFL